MKYSVRGERPGKVGGRRERRGGNKRLGDGRRRGSKREEANEKVWNIYEEQIERNALLLHPHAACTISSTRRTKMFSVGSTRRDMSRGMCVRGTPVPTPIRCPSSPSDPSGRSPGHRSTGTSTGSRHVIRHQGDPDGTLHVTELETSADHSGHMVLASSLVILATGVGILRVSSLWIPHVSYRQLAFGSPMSVPEYLRPSWLPLQCAAECAWEHSCVSNKREPRLGSCMRGRHLGTRIRWGVVFGRGLRVVELGQQQCTESKGDETAEGRRWTSKEIGVRATAENPGQTREAASSLLDILAQEPILVEGKGAGGMPRGKGRIEKNGKHGQTPRLVRLKEENTVRVSTYLHMHTSAPFHRHILIPITAQHKGWGDHKMGEGEVARQRNRTQHWEEAGLHKGTHLELQHCTVR
ncbi:hypothetical protein B0H19DRAFT_1067961 [Mycena capillaripes]|nr:hypothetical protein B0H19DRAFT_1067961 [Mycena capillaripes]